MLRQIARRDEETTKRILEQGRERLEGLAASTPVELQLQMNRDLGNFLLNLGRNEEANARFRSAYQLLPRLRGKITRAEYSRTMLDVAVGHLRVAETEKAQWYRRCHGPPSGGQFAMEVVGKKAAQEYQKA
ncbi:MAG: hypothetical protein O7J95_09635 [Planctomycetota bacterium]|nr:hypothetical protein [Planctomycetota bacterium]